MQSLAHLSNDELVAELTSCCTNMRRFKVRVLMFLAEVEEREIHLLAAASSLWDYARRFLHMSHGTAYRFIRGARLCKRFPFLLERIERGEVHLTTLTHIASFITEENVHALVEETCGKNRDRVDLVLRQWFGVEPTHGRWVSPMPYDEELLRLMERARDLLSHSIPSGDRLEIAKVAFHVLIAHLEKTRRAKVDNPRPAPAEADEGKSISAHATREMFEREGDQCAYVDERTGARCPSRAFIQRNHIVMRVHDGSDEPKNLEPIPLSPAAAEEIGNGEDDRRSPSPRSAPGSRETALRLAARALAAARAAARARRTLRAVAARGVAGLTRQ